MCIRDSRRAAARTEARREEDHRAHDEPRVYEPDRDRGEEPVSYTHLTLPTSDLV